MKKSRFIRYETSFLLGEGGGFGYKSCESEIPQFAICFL